MLEGPYLRMLSAAHRDASRDAAPPAPMP
jgi:hypothetical protein